MQHLRHTVQHSACLQPGFSQHYCQVAMMTMSHAHCFVLFFLFWDHWLESAVNWTNYQACKWVNLCLVNEWSIVPLMKTNWKGKLLRISLGFAKYKAPNWSPGWQTWNKLDRYPSYFHLWDLLHLKREPLCFSIQYFNGRCIKGPVPMDCIYIYICKTNSIWHSRIKMHWNCFELSKLPEQKDSI